MRPAPPRPHFRHHHSACVSGGRAGGGFRIPIAGKLTQSTQRHREHREEQRRSKTGESDTEDRRSTGVASTGGTPVSQVAPSVTRASRPCERHEELVSLFDLSLLLRALCASVCSV